MGSSPTSGTLQFSRRIKRFLIPADGRQCGPLSKSQNGNYRFGTNNGSPHYAASYQIDKTLVTDFGPLALEAVRETMIQSGNSRKYINKNIGRIKRMFKWGVAKELVPVEVYQALQTLDGLKKVKSKARENQPVLPVGDNVVEKTLKHCRPIIADMIRLQQATRCRPGELFVMRSCDIGG